MDTSLRQDSNTALVLRSTQVIYWCFWLIVPFCSFTSHTMLLAPSTLVVFIAGSFILFGVSRRASVHTVLAPPILCIVYIAASQAIGWIYFRFIRGKNIFFYLIHFMWISVAAIAFYQIYLRVYVESDLSFGSKFEIVQVAAQYFKKASLTNYIFGVGFSNALVTMGVYAHSYFMVFLIESGFVGLLLLIILLLSQVVFTRGKSLIILIPAVVTTLSATITFTPYLHICIGILFLYQRNQFRAAHAS